MRILVASFGPSNAHSGMGKWAHCMAETLRARGHHVTVWSGEDFPGVQRQGRLAFLGFPVALAARLVAHRRDFDAVVVHEPGGLWYAVLRRFFRSLPPMVLMCHNVESKVAGVMRGAERLGYARLPPWNRLSVRLLRSPLSDNAIRLADHVVCLSAEDVSYVATALGRGTGVTLNANGVAESHFLERPFAPGGARVLFVGGWLDVKGRRLLPPIWALVRERRPDARLTIVGPVEPTSDIRAEFAPEHRDSVSVVNTVSTEDEMVALYGAHDAFLMPSLTEATSLAMMEAMATGVPAVAARTGGLPDVITHDVDGLLFAPYDVADAADLIVRVLGDPLTARRLSERGRDRVRTFTWAAAATRLESAMVRAREPGVTAAPTPGPHLG